MSLGTIYEFIVLIGPALAGVFSTVLAAILAIKKVSTIINEFRQSNELKELLAAMKQQAAENKELKKMNKELLAELTKIKKLEE